MFNFLGCDKRRHYYKLLLLTLTFLFAGRVAGQLVVAHVHIGFLPPFERWSSGFVPYPLLVVIQVVLIVIMLAIVRDFGRGSGFFVSLNRKNGKLLIAFSALYTLAMIARYIVTMTMHPELRWFGGTIPIWFHFVLAGFIYLLGRFTVGNSGRKAAP